MPAPPTELRDAGRVLVVGGARSGIAAALALRRVLPSLAAVTLTDSAADAAAAAERERLEEAGIEVRLGTDDEALLEGCGLLIKSPGVPGESPLISAARRQGVKIWGEVELAARLLDNFIIGITGTNGKTTTTELIGHVLARAGRPCRVAGNVGTALSSLVGDTDPGEILVVELSSFQLEDSEEFRPNVAILLNLTEDHLNRHPSAAQYFGSKLRIFANQRPEELAILNLDDPVTLGEEIPGHGTRAWFSHAAPLHPAAGPAGERDEGVFPRPLLFLEDGEICADRRQLETLKLKLRFIDCKNSSAFVENVADGGRNAQQSGEESLKLLPWADVSLRGEHNLENCLAAASACLAAGLSAEEVAAGLRSFPGVRHRLQTVGVVDGVTYVNDSKATNVDAALKALTAFDGGIHLILGGSLKGCSFDPLAEAAAAGKVSEVLLIGQAAGEIAASLERAGREPVMAGELESALRQASAHARPGDVVLLAPACASYDQYGDYEERGEHFISLVQALEAKSKKSSASGKG